MPSSIWPDLDMLKLGLACKCPRCQKGDLFKPGWTLELNEKCGNCGLDLAKNDSADGPAVFLIFILGFTIIPLALILDAAFQLPLWVHSILWGGITLGVILGTLKPIKSYIIALQFKHRPRDWE